MRTIVCDTLPELRSDKYPSAETANVRPLNGKTHGYRQGESAVQTLISSKVD